MSDDANKVSAQATAVFKGLDYFRETQTDQECFAGRERELRQLSALIATERLAVLYARSGVGKTSLLLAGLFPDLRERGALPIYTRTLDEPLADLGRAIAAATGQLPIDPSAESILQALEAAARSASERNHRSIVIVLDQFEEFFTRHRDRLRQIAETASSEPDRRRLQRLEHERQEAFISAVLALSQDPRADIRILFSLREDHLGALDEFQRRLPGLFANSLRLLPLSAFGAHEAIVRPLHRHRITYQPEVVAQIVEDLREYDYDSARLQIVMTEIVEANREGDRPWQLDDAAIERFRDCGQTLAHVFERFLARVLRRLDEVEQPDARALLDALITRDRTKLALPEATLLDAVAGPDPAVRDRFARLLGRLANEDDAANRLLRRETRSDQPWFELIHECLIPALDEWLNVDSHFREFRRIRQEIADRCAEGEWRTNPLRLFNRDTLDGEIHRHLERLVLAPEPCELLARSALRHGGRDVRYWVDRWLPEGVDRSDLPVLLVEALNGSDPVALAGAARASLYFPEYAEELVEPCWRIAQFGLASPGERTDDADSPAVDSEAVRAASEALAHWAGIPAIREMAGHRIFWDRKEAPTLWSLLACAPPQRRLAALIAGAASGNANVRLLAVEAAAHPEFADYASDLRPSLERLAFDDPDRDTRSAAASAYIAQAGPDDIARIRKRFRIFGNNEAVWEFLEELPLERHQEARLGLCRGWWARRRHESARGRQRLALEEKAVPGATRGLTAPGRRGLAIGLAAMAIWMFTFPGVIRTLLAISEDGFDFLDPMRLTVSRDFAESIIVLGCFLAAGGFLGWRMGKIAYRVSTVRGIGAVGVALRRSWLLLILLAFIAFLPLRIYGWREWLPEIWQRALSPWEFPVILLASLAGGWVLRLISAPLGLPHSRLVPAGTSSSLAILGTGLFVLFSTVLAPILVLSGLVRIGLPLEVAQPVVLLIALGLGPCLMVTLSASVVRRLERAPPDEHSRARKYWGGYGFLALVVAAIGLGLVYGRDWVPGLTPRLEARTVAGEILRWTETPPPWPDKRLVQIQPADITTNAVFLLRNTNLTTYYGVTPVGSRSRTPWREFSALLALPTNPLLITIHAEEPPVYTSTKDPIDLVSSITIPVVQSRETISAFQGRQVLLWKLQRMHSLTNLWNGRLTGSGGNTEAALQFQIGTEILLPELVPHRDQSTVVAHVTFSDAERSDRKGAGQGTPLQQTLAPALLLLADWLHPEGGRSVEALSRFDPFTDPDRPRSLPAFRSGSGQKTLSTEVSVDDSGRWQINLQILVAFGSDTPPPTADSPAAAPEPTQSSFLGGKGSTALVSSPVRLPDELYVPIALTWKMTER